MNFFSLRLSMRKSENVLYGSARDIDVRKTVEDHHRPVREVGSEHYTEGDCQ